MWLLVVGIWHIGCSYYIDQSAVKVWIIKPAVLCSTTISSLKFKMFAGQKHAHARSDKKFQIWFFTILQKKTIMDFFFFFKFTRKS